MRHLSFWVLLTSILLGFVISCGYPSISYDVLYKKPTKQDIIGVWDVKNVVQTEKPKNGEPENIQHTLTLKENGTFEMTNVPGGWFEDEFGHSIGGFNSGSGKWHITKDNLVWTIHLDFDVWNGRGINFSTQFRFRGNKEPYTIFTWIGDPDNGEILEFEKRFID